MKFLSLLILILPLSVFAQDYSEAGVLIDLNAAIKIDRDWSLKSKLQARQSLIQNEAFENEVFNPEYGRVDLQTVLQRKLSANKVLGMGALYRNSNRGELVRFIQQFGWVNEAYRLKWAQRIRLDETLRDADDLEWRI
jgi:hypothetical protein